MGTTSRIQWIDTCKGIGIFLVVIGHTMIQNNYRGVIYSFHMPLFFFISGYLFSIKKYSNIGEVLFSKAKSLLVPYLFFSFISIILLRILIHQPIAVTTFIKTLLISKRNSIYYDDPLWFLTSLFTIEILFYLLLKYLKNNLLIFFIVMLLAYFSSIVLNPTGQNILPWSFDQSLYYIFYFGLGNISKNIGILKDNLKKSIYLIVLSFIYLVLQIDSSLFNKGLSFLHIYLHIPMDIVTFFSLVFWALMGTLFVIYISQFLSFIPYINFLGRISIIILALHVSLGFNLIHNVADRYLVLIKNPNLLGLAFAIGAIIIISPISIIINKFFPFILGKGSKIKKFN
jgi:acyltransferase